MIAVGHEDYASDLKGASLEGRLGDWTKLLTKAAVLACEATGWATAAKGHRLARMPEDGEEFLGIDVMAFKKTQGPWLFPVAALELENSRKDDRIAYSLWKVLNVRAKLRAVLCYRPSAEEGAGLVRYLSQSVVQSMAVADRSALTGETLIAVGYRNQAETFPYGFFKWWRLNANVGNFELF